MLNDVNLQFICEQEWDIAFLQEVTSKTAIEELVDRLNADE